MANPVDFTLYLITDRNQTGGRELCAVVDQALQGGVRAVQLREKDLSVREQYELASEMRVLTTRYGARLFINDRVDIALAVRADGVHLGEESLPVGTVRELLGPAKLIGVSCHSAESAIAAERGGADFITFGPVYYTPSKARYGEPLGLEMLKQVAGCIGIPTFGLGGIDHDRAAEVMACGASGVALISAIIAAPDPRSASQALIASLSR